jgi:hypothetical protein
MTKIQVVFVRAHRLGSPKSHDDGTGHCYVCGAPLDWEKWAAEEADAEGEALA